MEKYQENRLAFLKQKQDRLERLRYYQRKWYQDNKKGCIGTKGSKTKTTNIEQKSVEVVFN